jgi:hypothetical protein
MVKLRSIKRVTSDRSPFHIVIAIIADMNDIENIEELKNNDNDAFFANWSWE